MKIYKVILKSIKNIDFQSVWNLHSKIKNARNLPFIILIIISCQPVKIYSFNEATLNSEIDSLKESIIALDITRKKSTNELGNLIDKQNMSLKKEIDEYSAFIEYLSLQINQYCQQIYKISNRDSIKYLPCDVSNIQQETSKNDENSELKTIEEQIESLDNELMNAYAEFDEMLLKEEELLAAVNNKSQSNKTSNQSGEKGKNNGYYKSNRSGQLEKNDEAQENNIESNKKYYEEGVVSTSKRKKDFIISSKAKRKLDKIDDDIVARQLKEAAEKEMDEKLKEKLWEEYYKYKQRINR